ncbi:type II secretion system F family protein [Brachybacterium sp. J144]|uniref:type II secretion system F family protein n=1 Tax=Brachybacterium sp. J144 TaxID=3116487 RepID=UPI002E79CFB4|nr:type II secretion system F family protein [Brachybacterium sp. J144]MEE1652120.1 type II secretion system F family protein [Brachybacterium sp. J144]
MIPILAALLTVVAGSAIWLLIAGLRPVAAPSSTPRRSQLTRPQRKQLHLIAIGLVIGLLLWILTGYIAAVIAAPILALLAPQLIPRSTEKSTIARLTAMEEWTRSLVGLLGATASIEQAIIASRSSAPKALKEEIGMLAARLQSGIPIEQALTQFGDDLDDTTGDLLTGSLILGTRRRGAGLARLLEGTAETIADDVAARRQIEADRAKPRANARFITVIAVVVIAVEFLFNPAYVEPYRTALGQIILIALVALFLAALWWMNIVARDPKGQRLLRPTGDAS